MAIVRIVKRECPFAQIDRRPLNDDRLSFKATGILCYLLGKPCDWEVRMEELAGAKTDGVDAVRSAMQELRQFGYAKLETVHDEKTGRVTGKRWVIFEIPGDSRPDAPKRAPKEGKHRRGENTDIGKNPTSGKSDPTDKKEENTKKDLSGEAQAPDLFTLETKHPELPPPLCDSAELVEQWEGWKADRKARRKPLGATAVKMQVADLLSWGVERGIAALKHSRKNDYTGLFEPRAAKGSPAAPRAPITKTNALRMPAKA